LARVPGNPTVIASLNVAGTALTVPGVPPGTYVVTVVAVNAAGASAESNAIVVSVP
jgi:predicted phage tail protein